MPLESIIVIVIMVISFSCAAIWIAKNGGWQGEQCQGHCASCNHKCADALEARKEEAAQLQTDAKAPTEDTPTEA